MKQFTAFLKLIRLPNLLIIAFTQYMVRWCLLYPGIKGTEITLSYYCLTLPPEGMQFIISNFDFFLLCLSTVMIAAAGYIINDYFDVRIDRINKPEHMVIDKVIKRRVAMGAHVVINAIAFLIGVYLSWKYDFFYPGTFIFGISILLLWFYSTNLKRMFLLGNLTVAFLTGMVPMIIALFELRLQVHAHGHCFFLAKTDMKPLLLISGIFSLFAFIVTFLREVIKDIEDYEGDKANGCTTLAVSLGVNKSKMLVGILTFLVMGLLALIQSQQIEVDEFKQLHLRDPYSFWYFIIGLQLPFLFLAMRLFTGKEKKHFTFAGGLTKLIMLSGICYLFLYNYMLTHVYNEVISKMIHGNQ